MKNKNIKYHQFTCVDDVINFIMSGNPAKIILVDASRYDFNNQQGTGINVTNPCIHSKYFTTGEFKKINTEDSNDIRFDGWFDAEDVGYFCVAWDNGEENVYEADTLGYIVECVDNTPANVYKCCDSPNVIDMGDVSECQNCLALHSASVELPADTMKAPIKKEEVDTNTYTKVN